MDPLLLGLSIEFVLLALLAPSAVATAVLGLMLLRPGRLALTDTPLALPEPPKAPTLAERGLRETVGGWVGTLEGRPVRIRFSTEQQWTLELTLRRSQLEVIDLVDVEDAWRSGDPEFDALFRCLGDPSTHGELAAPVRSWLIEVSQRTQRVHVIAGKLEVSVPHIPALEEVLELCMTAATSLDEVAGDTAADRLEALVVGDPIDGVRAHALAVLHDVDPARGEAVAGRVETEDAPGLELEVALVAGNDEVLERVCTDDLAPILLRDRAARAVALTFAPARCGPIALALAASGEVRLEKVALQVALRAAEGGQDALLALLQAKWPDVVGGAADQLGQIGTAAAVPAMRRAMEDQLEHTVSKLRASIRTIQGRAAAGRGGVSLAATDEAEGRLSPVAARAGSLSET